MSRQSRIGGVEAAGAFQKSEAKTSEEDYGGCDRKSAIVIHSVSAEPPGVAKRLAAEYITGLIATREKCKVVD